MLVRALCTIRLKICFLTFTGTCRNHFFSVTLEDFNTESVFHCSTYSAQFISYFKPGKETISLTFFECPCMRYSSTETNYISCDTAENLIHNSRGNWIFGSVIELIMNFKLFTPSRFHSLSRVTGTHAVQANFILANWKIWETVKILPQN